MDTSGKPVYYSSARAKERYFMVKETVIFALTSSTDLASRIARELGLGLGKIKVEKEI